MKTKSIDIRNKRYIKLLSRECDYWIFRNKSLKVFKKQINKTIRQDKQHISQMIRYNMEF